MLAVMEDSDFWLRLDELVATCKLVIDRPKGVPHPRYPAFLYPLDYGYLEGTRSGDGDGIDVWVGSQPERGVTAIVCAVEVQQQDAEIKVLLGCTPQEAQTVLATHNVGSQSAVLLRRKGGGSPAGESSKGSDRDGGSHV